MQNHDHVPGEPCWATLATADPEAAVPFYQRLLGWNATWAEGAADMSLDAKPVARIAPAADGASGWLTHIAVDDVERSVDRAVGAGGSALLTPTTDGDSQIAGAVLTDPAGVRFAIRQPPERRTSSRAGQPGTLAWGELITDDVAASAAFYRAVFGWTLTEPEGPLQRRQWQLAGRSIAGLLPRPPAMPVEIPPYWDIYFAVRDTAASAAIATTNGATQLMAATPIEIGTIAVFADPLGAVFTLVQLTDQEPTT
ncbi:MAG: Glyoxalase/bleomycin resistance protein/dioxygenase [Actinomycetia bacterium]|nr:Glyoxalase/bleomycin resistance protein/dioxygenase [Actinomycetes bacterium]